MIWLILGVIVLAVVTILLLNRFYIKASREVALVRTGRGGQRVVLDGGVFSLPFLNRTAEVNMRTMRLEVERAGETSIITQDRLRIDATAEFYVRVEPTAEGVATAAQALGSKAFRASDLADLLEGKLTDALLSVAATYTMDTLQDDRGRYVAEVADVLEPRLKANGLLIEAVSLTRLDQTPFGALDQNNAFNAVGMRRLAEVIATNKKERAEIENEAETAVRQSHLDAAKRRLLIEQEEEEAQLAQGKAVEAARAKTMAEIAEAQAEAEERREYARIQRDMEVRAKQIQSDQEVAEIDYQAERARRSAKADSEIQIAAKKAEAATAQAAAAEAIASEVIGRERVITAKETAMAERVKALAVIEAQKEAAIDDTRVASEADTVRAMAEAEARAEEMKAAAAKTRLLAQAEGEAALFSAQNAQADAIVKMKVDLAKIDALPEVVREMVKPAEKIDSIRINHVTGFGAINGGATGGNGVDGPMVNQVMDGILGMALQLPAVQKLGEEIGMNVGGGLGEMAGRLRTDSQQPSDAASTPPKNGASD
ncbi:MAG: flotillin domain-containing protein [Pseudomonadota bacterium]